MARSFDYLLLGGGTSCGYAAAAIRELDKNGSVGIISADSEPPYDRPPFSKGFLTNDDMRPSDAHAKDESFYPNNGIELILNSEASGLDLGERTVALGDGGVIGYGKLLYALGSAPNPLRVPGGHAVFLLRTAADSERIRDAANAGRSAVIVGGGYIGAEVAASLLKRGVRVTLIEVGESVWALFPSRPVAEAVQRELQAMGAEVITGEGVTDVVPGEIMRVKTSSGREIEADFVVVGVGAAPRVTLARDAGLALGEKGVRADATLQASDPNVWVAGDVAEYDDQVVGRRYRAEHHLHAKGTGAHAGKVMAGHEEPYRAVPYFFSDIGELSMNLRGDPQPSQRSFVFGDPSAPVLTDVFVHSDGRIAGVVDIRRDYKAQEPLNEMFEALILNGANVGPFLSDLQRPDFDVQRLKGLASG